MILILINYIQKIKLFSPRFCYYLYLNQQIYCNLMTSFNVNCSKILILLSVRVTYASVKINFTRIFLILSN